MGSKANVKIDHTKLKSELNQRGLTNYVEINRRMGYGVNAIQQALKRDSMTPLMAHGLKTTYGINPEDIAPDPEPVKEPEKKPEAPQAAQTCTGLTETQVYQAVKAAMWDALRERDDEKAQKAKTSNGDAQYVLIYRAMLDAVNQAFKINAKEIRGLIFAATVNAVRMSLKKDMLNDG